MQLSIQFAVLVSLVALTLSGTWQPVIVPLLTRWGILKPTHTNFIEHIDIPSFIRPEECLQFIEETERALKTAVSISHGNSYWNSRVVYPGDIAPDKLHRIKQLVVQIQDITRSHFRLPEWERLYVDALVLSRMKQNDSVGWHADNAFFPNCDANYASQRTWSAVLYLNGHDGVRGVAEEPKFAGGVFQFLRRMPEEIVPHAGRLLIFGAGCDYYHRATPVESGTRYTIALWFNNRRDMASPQFHDKPLGSLPAK
jgi:hypothetical protein